MGEARLRVARTLRRRALSLRLRAGLWALTAASVRNSCLAVTIDTGDPDNIHPKDKLPAGERLAFCALAKHYGKKISYSVPALASVKRLPGSIRLRFAHTDGGLVTKGPNLEEFAIAGDDRKWHWAGAHIEGNTVVVSSASVPNPKEVRYAWQSNPAATLFRCRITGCSFQNRYLDGDHREPSAVLS